MSTRSASGKQAKIYGHMFESEVATILQKKFNSNFIVDGAPGTKIDIINESGDLRYSLKKTPTDLQVGLITQNNFIAAMNICDADIINFIKDFFGGDWCSQYNRHRKTLDDMPADLNVKFLDFMNNNIKDILKIAVTHGSLVQQSSINYILFPEVRHNAGTLKMIEVEKMVNDFVNNGKWVFSPQKTSLHFYVNSIKVMALQMFGSGPKYKNGYHSLQFRITCGKITGNYVTKV